jgi:hypothetical protein
LCIKVYFQSFGIDFDPSKSLVDETLFDSIKQNTQQKGGKKKGTKRGPKSKPKVQNPKWIIIRH